MSKVHQMSDPRQAGRVRRYHTWSVLQQQTVAEHSWQVMRVLLAIWPEAAEYSELMQHCLNHDCGEIVTGDLPYPVKSDNPLLKETIDRIEDNAILAMAVPWNFPPPAKLDKFKRDIFKIAEFIEMWEFALNEIELGNRHGIVVRERCYAPIVERGVQLTQDFPDDITAIAVRDRVTYYMKRRISVHEEYMRDE